jgi:hypothetical protein
MATITIVDPAGAPVRISDSLAPRPTSLRGKRVGLLANGKPNSVELLDYVGSWLREVHGAQLRRVKKETAGKPVNDEQIAALRECDVILTGSGD